jgi:hypothetical protein
MGASDGILVLVEGNAKLVQNTAMVPKSSTLTCTILMKENIRARLSFPALVSLSPDP